MEDNSNLKKSEIKNEDNSLIKSEIDNEDKMLLKNLSLKKD